MAEFPTSTAGGRAIAALPGLEASLRPDAGPPAARRVRRPPMTDAYIYDAIRTPRGKGRPDGACTR